MIYVSALFSAMVILAVDAVPIAEKPNSDQLLRRIRPGLLALKQFESVYVLAQWIRRFFMNSITRWGRDGQGSRDVSPGPNASSGRRQDASVLESMAPNASQGIYLADASRVQSNHDLASSSQEDVAPMVRTETLADFMLGPYAGQHGDLERGERAYWAGYSAGGTEGFPVPESNQYQAIYFLADLGMPWIE